MTRHKRAKGGTVLIAAGLLLLLASLLLVGYNLWDERRAGQAVDSVMEQMAQAIPSPGAATLPEGMIPDHILAPNIEMPTLEVDENDYVGYLSIPALSMDLPVLSDWSYPKLKQAPCRYSGSAYQDNLVICAHNYAKHFGSLGQLTPGDQVSFVDIDGNEFQYQVVELVQLRPEEVQEMVSGEWALSLFTCTLDGRLRMTVRCERI